MEASYAVEVPEEIQVGKRKAWSVSSIPTIPHIDPSGLELLQKKMLRCKVFLEYGGGGSTVFAATHGPASIFTVATDADFLKAVSDRLAQVSYPLKKKRPKFAPIYVNVGPTGNWGFPADPSTAASWPKYSVHAWDSLQLAKVTPDLILIDGRFRVACFLASLIFARPGCTILFDDYADRPQYHSVEKFLKPVSIAGRMAEFVIPPNIMSHKLILELVKASTSVE